MSRALEVRKTIDTVFALYHNNYSWFREVDDRPGLRGKLYRVIKAYVKEAYEDIELHEPGSTDTPCEIEIYYATIDMVLWTIENFNE